jgi:hypothetical protein
MISISIDKAQIKSEADRAAFGIVQAALERALKKIEPDLKKEKGSVEVTVTGPGLFKVEMEGLSPKLRKKVSAILKTFSS